MARAVERAGFDACHVTDHPFPTKAWLDAGGHHSLDPFVVLAIVGAHTSRLRLHTNAYIPAYRNPFVAAKGAATLDALTGGRSEERRVGKECRALCRSRWSPYH